MQPLEQTLEEVRNLHQRVFGRPAPELTPEAFAPMPVGIDPFHFVRDETRHVQELAERAFLAPQPGAWNPLADTFVGEDELRVTLEIPGVSREDVKVHVAGRECIVRGERKPPKCDTGTRPMVMERPWGSFERRFVLPAGSRTADIVARYTDGLLELTVPVDPAELSAEHEIEVA